MPESTHPLIEPVETGAAYNTESESAGAEKEFTIQTSLKSIALACLGQLLDYDEPSEVVCHEQQFLNNYYQPLKNRVPLKQQLHDYLQHAQAEDLGLMVLANKLPLDDLCNDQ